MYIKLTFKSMSGKVVTRSFNDVLSYETLDKDKYYKRVLLKTYIGTKLHVPRVIKIEKIGGTL